MIINNHGIIQIIGILLITMKLPMISNGIMKMEIKEVMIIEKVEEDIIIIMENTEEVEIVVGVEVVEEEAVVEVDIETTEETIMKAHQMDGIIIEATVVIMKVGFLMDGITIRLNIRNKRTIGDPIIMEPQNGGAAIIIMIGGLQMLIIRMKLLILGGQIM